jgi:hypothetical protein
MVGSYKQVKHALGWSAYQVRTDTAIRRHWQLVCCAFSFCWWAYGRLPTDDGEESAEHQEGDLPPGRGERRGRRLLLVSWPQALRAVRGVAGTVGDAVALLECVLRSAPADGAHEVCIKFLRSEADYAAVREHDGNVYH